MSSGKLLFPRDVNFSKSESTPKWDAFMEELIEEMMRPLPPKGKGSRIVEPAVTGRYSTLTL